MLGTILNTVYLLLHLFLTTAVIIANIYIAFTLYQEMS